MTSRHSSAMAHARAPEIETFGVGSSNTIAMIFQIIIVQSKHKT